VLGCIVLGVTFILVFSTGFGVIIGHLHNNPLISGLFTSGVIIAGAGYTWSVPTFIASNLIQRPIYETRDIDYLPTITYNGTTPSGTEIKRVRYKIVSNRVFLSIHQEFTVAWVGNSTVTATLPMSEKVTFTTDWLTWGLNIGTGSWYGVWNAYNGKQIW